MELASSTITLIDRAAKSESVLLSAISAWEIEMLVAKGRLVLPDSPESHIRRLFSRSGVNEEPVTSNIAELSARLPGDFHGDPADRIIVATAVVRSATLVTRDERIRTYARRTRFVTVIGC